MSDPEIQRIPYRELGRTGIPVPPVIFGTSCLGNLYEALDMDTKRRTVEEMFAHLEDTVVLDSAGKYGAGLALEVIGMVLKSQVIPPERVIMSNKLGWYRIPLETEEPTFEPGVWKGIQHDAVQKISYDGILECWEQGCRLLGAAYRPQLLSVHDPDEYLAANRDEQDRKRRFGDIREAYRALIELRDRKETRAVGIGAKDWRIIREIVEEIDVDWVMFANSFTIYHHPRELLDFISQLQQRQVGIINSAVFHAGFLTGGKYFDYRVPDPSSIRDKPLFKWRDVFFRLCETYEVSPAEACVSFALSHPAVLSVALNTSRPARIKQNIRLTSVRLPEAFWGAMRDHGLIGRDYPHI